jgi:hypothetical protein
MPIITLFIRSKKFNAVFGSVLDKKYFRISILNLNLTGMPENI